MKKTIAVSIGDLNGIGFEIAVRSHDQAKNLANIKYLVSQQMADQACEKLGVNLPKDFDCVLDQEVFEIEAGKVSAVAGKASFDSFASAVDMVRAKKADAVVTLPINKESWAKAGLAYKGHTDYLKEQFGEAIMMLGCEQMFVALYTDHLPISAVPPLIRADLISEFLIRFARCTTDQQVGVLGLNPHAGDNGTIGSEDIEITKAIEIANLKLQKELFVGALVPDTAFTKPNRERFRTFVAMYHDQGLIPLKTLYFDESINVTLGIEMIRVSVDHGTAFDKAYRDQNPSNLSYINAIKYAVKVL